MAPGSTGSGIGPDKLFRCSKSTANGGGTSSSGGRRGLKRALGTGPEKPFMERSRKARSGNEASRASRGPDIALLETEM